jgi:hypothetical protein
MNYEPSDEGDAPAPVYSSPASGGSWWVGYNADTTSYSIAADTSFQSGADTLTQAGYSQIVLGPVSYSEAVGYLGNQ